MQRGAGPVSITRGKGTALGRTSKGATEGVHASHIVYKQASEYFYMICDQLKLNERALLLLRLACDPVPRRCGAGQPNDRLEVAARAVKEAIAQALRTVPVALEVPRAPASGRILTDPLFRVRPDLSLLRGPSWPSDVAQRLPSSLWGLGLPSWP